MKWELCTGEGLAVGWTELDLSSVHQGILSGPFYPNDFYSLIRPIIRQFHWPIDIGIGEITESEWLNELPLASDAVVALHLYLRNSETGKQIGLSLVTVEERNSIATLSAYRA